MVLFPRPSFFHDLVLMPLSQQGDQIARPVYDDGENIHQIAA
jgi:hypothetical protein